MIINKINFPIYQVLILFSIILGGLYILISTKKYNIPQKNKIIFFVLFFFLSISLGKIYTYIEHPQVNILKAGVTGYGGLIGALLAAIIYKVIYKDNTFFKYTIISLPLIYGFAKLACFFHGCCYGIPYTGPLSVTYPHIMNKQLLPIQLIESILFIILFQICNTLNNHKNINFITLILTFILKFILDYFRYAHINIFITNNQIMSLILCFITIIIYFIKKKKALN